MENMGKNHEQLKILCFKEDNSTLKNVLESKQAGPDNYSFDYTNRRRIKETPAPVNCIKNNKERKIENEQEFEDLCFHIQECSLSEGVEKNTVSRRKSSSTSTSSSASSSYESQVEAFRKFVQDHGGHYGGWKVKDHLYFLKVKSKFPLNKTAEMIHEHYPDISVNTVLEHDAWYNQYSKLRTANKIAIDEWRKTQKPQVKDEKKPESDVKSISGTIKRDPNIKEKIEIWKAKTLAANIERLQKHREEEMKKKREEEEKKMLQNERKNVVNRYREEKMNYDLAMKAAEEVAALEAKREAVQRGAKLLKYFRYEDRRFTERQKSKRQPKVKEEPKIKATVHVKRDPNRLLRPTQGWIQHTKRTDTEGSSAQTYPLYISHLRKLGKPAWRKSITS